MTGTPVQSILIDFATTNVAATYVQLDASLDKDVRAVEIYNSTSNFFMLGYGPASSEVDLTRINPGLSQYHPLHLPQGVRLAIKNGNGTATISSGIVTINFYG